MRSRFSGSEVPFHAPSKNKGMKMEYRLLHDIVSKALCAKDGSFDMVTSEKFDLMVAISAGLKVNWAQILFNTLLAMVNNPSSQSQGYAVQISILLGTLVKANLGESVNLQPHKVVTGKSMANYIKKNLNVTPAGDSSKQTEDTASNTEGGESQIAQTEGKETSVVEKEKAASKKKKGETAVVDRTKKKLCPSNADPPPAKTTQATAQGPKNRKETAGSYELNQRCPTPCNSTESSKQHKAESAHLPQKARMEPDAYANRLHKGDVFAHLTSFKQKSESNIQTKRLSKRSPTLPLLLQSELSTVGNRRR
ncbi:hypothetical protein F511_27876 [Dorcoceras hygrometricum]|uniref:Uncharacterized protein n=1 Tax=Dorcoceras hygrometricum TaxID=472368 RepID=A0A2Z7ADJ7_9LAMI|nr:hypothetical protein F511_27876 [Dorcoceras hygrometricum]